MLDLHNGLALVEGVLHSRHEQLVREQRRHRLAGEARAARTPEREPRPRRRVLARLIPAVR